MIALNLEIYNAAELMQGDGRVVVPPQTLPAFEGLEHWSVPFAAADSEGLWLSRIPNALRLSLNPAAMVNSVSAAGVELRFNLRSADARFVLKCNDSPGIVEIYQGSFLMGWQVVGTAPTEVVVTPIPISPGWLN